MEKAFFIQIVVNNIFDSQILLKKPVEFRNKFVLERKSVCDFLDQMLGFLALIAQYDHFRIKLSKQAGVFRAKFVVEFFVLQLLFLLFGNIENVVENF